MSIADGAGVLEDIGLSVDRKRTGADRADRVEQGVPVRVFDC